MGILETLKGKLGLQPTEINSGFADRLQEAKQTREARQTEELKRAAEEEQQKQREREQQFKEDRATIRRLSSDANKLFRPKLEAIKKVYGKGKGDIMLTVSKNSQDRPTGVSLVLVWNKFTIDHPADLTSRTSHGSYKTKAWRETYLFVGIDGLGELGSRLCSENRSNGNRFDPEPIKFNTKDPNWQNEVVEKIPEIVQR